MVIYTGKKNTIEEKDVIELVGRGSTKKIFDLIDAVSLKNRKSALTAVRRLAPSKGNVPEVIGLIGWQFRRIWKAKLLLARGGNKDSIASELKLRDFAVGKFMNQVACFTEEELKKNFKLLVEADHRLKNGRERPDFIIERLVIMLSSV